MKPIILILVLVACMPVTTGHMVIEEVLYDPAVESGGEAVLLYNPDNVSVDLSGWILSTESSAADATLPSGSFIPAFGTFLVADTGWELLKEDLPSADHEESITLTNTDAGLALKDSTGTIIDAVGWGLSAGIKAGLFEGTPHNGTKEGFSLRRTQDTDNNLADFVVAEPSFIVVTNGIDIPLTLDVKEGLGLSAFVPSVFTPIAGELVNLTISINTSQHAYVLVEGFNQTIDATTSDGVQHTATITIPYWQTPANYSLRISSGNLTLNRSIVITPVTSIGIDAPEIVASALIAGSVRVLEGDTDMFTKDKPTLINNGNTFADVIITATTPAKGSALFALDNIKYGLGLNVSTLKASQVRSVKLAPRETLPLSLWFTVPMLQEGTYEGSLMIAGKEAK